ncbi:MAG: extracellular solute-binding protein, partial [Candidatus Limnocylindria bacterium]
MVRRFGAVGIVLSLIFILAACGENAGDSPGASEAPDRSADASEGSTGGDLEDTLTVLCTPQEDWCQVMVAAFQEETGIETSYVRLSSGEALARLRASADAPEFSVWWGGPADGFVAAHEEELIEVYDSPNAEAIAAEQKSDEAGVWTGVYVGALGFCSNTTRLEDLGVDVPTSWEALTDPALQGEVAMAHPASSGTAYTAFYT